jgi:hypothetical protein
MARDSSDGSTRLAFEGERVRLLDAGLEFVVHPLGVSRDPTRGT